MRLIFAFLLQWIATTIGLWLAVGLLGSTTATYDTNSQVSIFVTAGFVLSLVNIFIRPVITIISLPITLLTLGLFMLVVNGFMVWLALQWTVGIEMSFFHSIIAGVIIGIVNVVISHVAGLVKSDDLGNKENI